MRETISSVSQIIIMISMLVFLMSIIWCIVRLFRRKKIKPSLILSASSIGAFILFTIIGATAWSGTEEYKIAMAEREQKEIEQEKLDKKEEALEKKETEKKKRTTEQDASAGKEQINESKGERAKEEAEIETETEIETEEKEIETIFYGEIGLDKESYKGEKVAFSFKCGYAIDYEEVEEITTETNLCYGSVEVQFEEPQKITEGEYITVYGVIGEDHGATALKNSIILERGEKAEENYNNEIEDFKQSFLTAETVSYDDLLRYPDTYYNQKVKIELDITKVEPDGTVFHGDIAGVIPGTENEVALYDYRDNREPRIQEGDKLIVYGVGNKTVTMKVKDGSGLFADTIDEYDIPCLYVQYIDFR